MSDKAILCYICNWSHASPHVYSFVGGLVPGSSGGSDVGWYCCSSYGVANPLSSFSPFSNSSIGDTILSPMVGCKHVTLYFSGTGRASQETAIAGSSQHALLGIHNSVRVSWLYMGRIPRWDSLWTAFPSFLLCTLFPFARVRILSSFFLNSF